MLLLAVPTYHLHEGLTYKGQGRPLGPLAMQNHPLTLGHQPWQVPTVHVPLWWPFLLFSLFFSGTFERQLTLGSWGLAFLPFVWPRKSQGNLALLVVWTPGALTPKQTHRYACTHAHTHTLTHCHTHTWVLTTAFLGTPTHHSPLPKHISPV